MNTDVSPFIDIQTEAGIEIGMTCGHCKIDKPLSEFYVDRGAKCGYRARCKSCCAQDQKEWRDRNPEGYDKRKNKAREYAKLNPPKYNSEQRKKYYKTTERNYILGKLFGITENEYKARWESQGECCAICGRLKNDSQNRKFSVDHEHDTKRVRGILCGRCNPALGMFDDKPDRILAAIAYILKYRNMLEL